MIAILEDPQASGSEREAFNWELQRLILVNGWGAYTDLLSTSHVVVRKTALAKVKPWAPQEVFERVVRMMADGDPTISHFAQVTVRDSTWVPMVPALFEALADPRIPEEHRPMLLEGLERKGFVAHREPGGWKLYRRSGGRKKTLQEIKYERWTRERRARWGRAPLKP